MCRSVWITAYTKPQTKLLSVGQHSKSVILNSNLCGFLLKWLDFDYKMWLLSVNVITSLEKLWNQILIMILKNPKYIGAYTNKL